MSCLWAETVYKTVDEDGNVVFTDQPSENTEEIKLQKLQTVENPHPAKYRASSKLPGDTQAALYKSLLVTNPADGSGLRNNSGNVSISILVEPSLRRGHKIIISMDGKEIGSGSRAALQNVDRGTHSISASVVDGNGKKLISTSSNFSMLRASK